MILTLFTLHSLGSFVSEVSAYVTLHKTLL